MLRFSSLWPHCRFPTVSCGLSIVPVKKGMMIRGLGVGEVSQNRDTVRDDASAKFGAFVSFWLIICSCRPQDGSFMELRHAYLLQVFFLLFYAIHMLLQIICQPPGHSFLAVQVLQLKRIALL